MARPVLFSRAVSSCFGGHPAPGPRRARACQSHPPLHRRIRQRHHWRPNRRRAPSPPCCRSTPSVLGWPNSRTAPSGSS
eukprot:11175161-Lingulodinium_polyedra.AAC.1